MNYCNKRKIPYAVMVGESEMEQNKYLLKNMNSGDQKLLSLEDLIKTVS